MRHIHRLTAFPLLTLLIVACATSMAVSDSSAKGKSGDSVPSDATESNGANTGKDGNSTASETESSGQISTSTDELQKGWQALEERLSVLDATGSRKALGELRELLDGATLPMQTAAAPRIDTLERAVTTLEAWRASRSSSNPVVPVHVLISISDSLREPVYRAKIIEQLLDRARGTYTAGETDAVVFALLQIPEALSATSEVVQKWHADATPKPLTPQPVQTTPGLTLFQVLVVNVLFLVVCGAGFRLWTFATRNKRRPLRRKEAAMETTKPDQTRNLLEQLRQLDVDNWKNELPRLREVLDKRINAVILCEMDKLRNQRADPYQSTLSTLKREVEDAVAAKLKESQTETIKNELMTWNERLPGWLTRLPHEGNSLEPPFVMKKELDNALDTFKTSSSDFEKRLQRLEFDEMMQKVSGQRVSMRTKLATAEAVLPVEWRTSLEKGRSAVEGLRELGVLREQLLQACTLDLELRHTRAPELGAAATILRNTVALANRVLEGEELLEKLSGDPTDSQMEDVSAAAALWIERFTCPETNAIPRSYSVEALLPRLHDEIVASWEPILRWTCNLGDRALFDRIRHYLSPLGMEPVDSLRGTGYEGAFHDIESVESVDSELREGQIVRTNRAAFTLKGGGLHNSVAAKVVVCRLGNR